MIELLDFDKRPVSTVSTRLPSRSHHQRVFRPYRPRVAVGWYQSLAYGFASRTAGESDDLRRYSQYCPHHRFVESALYQARHRLYEHSEVEPKLVGMAPPGADSVYTLI